MGVYKKVEWTEKKAQIVLENCFLSKNTKQYEISNLFVYNWESDYLAITKSGYVYEVEIKISRADFSNDFKHKENKHLLLESDTMIKTHPQGCPNYFYYAVPDGLISADDVPKYAGLMYLQPWGINIVKEAPKINDEKVDLDMLKLRDKFYWNMITWKNRYDEISESAETIKSLKKEIKGLMKTIMYYDNELSTLNCELCDAKLKIEKYEKENEERNCETSKGTLQS